MTNLVSNFNWHNLDWRSIVGAVALLVFGLIAGGGVGLSIAPDGNITVGTDYSIELSDEQIPALIETVDGRIEELSVPTVESIDSEINFDDNQIPDFGMGAWRDMSSPEAYKNAILGVHLDFDGVHGEQCVDPFAEFHYNYTGRWLSTNGTGAAYGLWDANDYNAGDDYVLITDPIQLKPGAWAVFGGGQYGHVGMVIGYYNNGYIALLGANQGGEPGVNGGAAVNIINISLRDFRGAFFPKMWIKEESVAPEPQPEIPVSGCIQWHVEQGDTMSKIMLDCENTIVYGEAMDDYAKTWYSLVIKPGQSVYDGWATGSGYGLYANDDIEHRVGQ